MGPRVNPAAAQKFRFAPLYGVLASLDGLLTPKTAFSASSTSLEPARLVTLDRRHCGSCIRMDATPPLHQGAR